LGRYANAAKKGEKSSQNCKYVPTYMRETALFVHPHERGKANPVGVQDRVFLELTRDVVAGEEIIVSYGTGYWQQGHDGAA
jgi:hypothetical protein|tara:strand:+ start:166 stop:408 length:243 start_codon:yes stop_codon:yes gene_type:complete